MGGGACNMSFMEVISQMNGQDYSSRTHVFSVRKTRIKLSQGLITKAREIYSTSMQLCGVRGNIKAPPAKALFCSGNKEKVTLSLRSYVCLQDSLSLCLVIF
ncbi:hypothetical protein Bca52824_028047 [Brassica carinata]|uniref:Stomatal closure-related actin-binding protein PH domain-containing protein n=1 Tax=Brassica carinata TaxID=52824 RepID=A0A8X7VBT1_BRACI|nr:hypothetical protein Bca52824_028047 [Brassica carinata]